MATPKSNVKLTLDDDQKEGSLPKSVSDPGRSGGASKTRDMSQTSILKSDGVETEIDESLRIDEELPVVQAAGPTPKEYAQITLVDPKNPSAGFNITDSRTDQPATGLVYIGSRLWTVEELQGKLDSREIDSLGSRVPGQSPSGEGQGGVPLPPGFEEPTDLRSIDPETGFPIDPVDGVDPVTGVFIGDDFTGKPTGGAKFSASLLGDGGVDVEGHKADVALVIEDMLKRLQEDGNIPIEELASPEELERLSQFPGITFSGLDATRLGLSDREIARLSGGTGEVRLGIGSRVEKIPGLEHLDEDELIDRERGGLSNERTVYFYTDPGTNLPIKSAGGEEISVDPLTAESAIMAHQTAVETLTSLIGDRAGQRGELITAQLEEALAAVNASFDFDIRELEATSASQRRIEEDREKIKAQAAADEKAALQDEKWQRMRDQLNQEFEERIRASENEHATKLSEMELAWVHGSIEEASAARAQARMIEMRTLEMQQQQLQISMLGLLGQHPQLRGLIGALGIFKGQNVGGFDIDAFFNGTLPQGNLPTAQEFNRLSPSEQENMLNELAGRFGQSPEIIAQTIRENAPTGTRRLT